MPFLSDVSKLHLNPRLYLTLGQSLTNPSLDLKLSSNFVYFLKDDTNGSRLPSQSRLIQIMFDMNLIHLGSKGTLFDIDKILSLTKIPNFSTEICMLFRYVSYISPQ